MTHREKILAAALRVQAAERELQEANAALTDTLLEATDDGAPLRQIAPLLGISASTLLRRLHKARPPAVASIDPLDREAT